ncbi:UDP-N-acetylmuramate dehydrogenase [Carboxylicivirga marina]|uniref:UDP-N-acetylenolpyruvoylglucosamine reductase n=1 Tax=Carboxylicivirga marina TaxID=2800988 RepID=A0ABS1HLE1_9BACT|nr:UDP-N-acetylmuramate dehydrogenase [Carboxylicivirga marina]MBK3518499.1 UDP-N-acetylmuramate dehydrogenase [Carboxylicivirga marina]
MIQTTDKVNLRTYNTFGIEAKADEFITCNSIDDIKSTLKYLKNNPQPYLILGGGSNILFCKDFEGIIIHPQITDITLLKQDDSNVWLEVGAGVVWDDLVEHCVNNNWYGLENLSYIPGNVGASPVQNIGAYGVEAKDCIESVNGFYIDSTEAFELSNNECRFAYRQSIFKSELKNKTIISSVVFKLNKQESYKLNYGDVKEQVESFGKVTLRSVRQTITNIRKSKLPEPEEMGNAGSFFKNPVIGIELFQEIKGQYPTIPSYPISEQLVKVPAGWLIEQSGWKGKAIGDAAVHSKQALVLINKGNATGNDILKLAHQIIKDVNNQFNITIEPEVNII